MREKSDEGAGFETHLKLRKHRQNVERRLAGGINNNNNNNNSDKTI